MDSPLRRRHTASARVGPHWEILEAPGAYPPTWLWGTAADNGNGVVVDDAFGERGVGEMFGGGRGE